MCKLPAGNDLVNRARELGVDMKGDLFFQGPDRRREDQAPDHELQRRVIEAERAIRESKMWKWALISAIIALISAIASAASAVTAIISVARR
jgi:hypothetical protein